MSRIANQYGLGGPPEVQEEKIDASGTEVLDNIRRKGCPSAGNTHTVKAVQRIAPFFFIRIPHQKHSLLNANKTPEFTDNKMLHSGVKVDLLDILKANFISLLYESPLYFIISPVFFEQASFFTSELLGLQRGLWKIQGSI